MFFIMFSRFCFIYLNFISKFISKNQWSISKTCKTGMWTWNHPTGSKIILYNRDFSINVNWFNYKIVKTCQSRKFGNQLLNTRHHKTLSIIKFSEIFSTKPFGPLTPFLKDKTLMLNLSAVRTDRRELILFIYVEFGRLIIL